MNQPHTTPWTLQYDQWLPDQQPLREALCTLGNGVFATRGAAEEASAGGPHYPGTYLAGGYNRLKTEIAGRTIENEDFVNFPNWLPLTFRPAGGRWFDLSAVEILDFHQELDVRRGLLTRALRIRDDADRVTRIESRRFVHMADARLAGLTWKLTAENWSGPVDIRTALDGSVINAGVERYRDLSSKHLEVLDTGTFGDDGIYLRVRTVQSRLEMTQAARTRIYAGDELDGAARETDTADETVSQIIRLDLVQRQTAQIEKVAAIVTSRHAAISEPLDEACKAVRRAPRFDVLLDTHAREWANLWRRCDLVFTGDDYCQFLLRFHIFHLLQTTSMNTIDSDVGVPSRGLHGEAYRGHILWDEIFIFPFLNLRLPEVVRALLMYRYRRLPEAMHAANEAGYRGAMYPWQSGSDGREESQLLHLNPASGRWIPDETWRQRHVGAAIAWNTCRYYQATGDIEFLSFYGAEMILQIARFWASLAEYNKDRDRYEIRGVVGPDEFHTRYPDADEGGLNNNAYTNVLAAWVLRDALRVLETVGEDRQRELLDTFQIPDDELQQWDTISRKMFIPFHDNGLISQFEGYETLEEFDWEGYREKHGDIQRLDRILEAEGDTPNRYKASKQADVLMLFFLFSAEELGELFKHMGYDFDPDLIPRNIDYYMKRTSHGSTLSRVVHAWVLARSDRKKSWDLFGEAIESDITDIQGGTTPEGIHLGAMAGTIDLMQRCYTGIETRGDVLWFNPALPEEIHELCGRIRYRGHWLSTCLNHRELSVTFERGWASPARIGVHGEVHTMDHGEHRTFPLNPKGDHDPSAGSKR